MAAVAFREMRRAGKAASQGHVDHAHIGLHQQIACFLQPQLHIVALGAAIQVAAEQAFQLPGRHADLFGQIGGRHRVFDIAFHHLDDLAQFGVPHTDPGGDRQALAVLIGADGGVDQLIGHGVGQIFALIRRDDLEHKVNRGGAARCGPAVAIHHKDRLGQFDLLELLQKAVLILPMDGGLLAIKQPRLGDGIGPGAKPAHCHPAPRLAAQPVQHALGRGTLHIDAAADQHNVIPLNLIQPDVEFEGCAVRAGHEVALTCQHPAVKLLARDPVGNAQGLDGAGKGQHCKALKQQKNKALGAGGLGDRGGLALKVGHLATCLCRFRCKETGIAPLCKANPPDFSPFPPLHPPHFSLYRAAIPLTKGQGHDQGLEKVGLARKTARADAGLSRCRRTGFG